jgi:hypothetical protein
MNDSASLAVVRLPLIYTKRAAPLHLTCAGFGRNAPLSVAHFVHATVSGAFRPRHCQWRAAIRIFEILRFSLLFLIIIIINKNWVIVNVAV